MTVWDELWGNVSFLRLRLIEQIDYQLKLWQRFSRNEMGMSRYIELRDSAEAVEKRFQDRLNELDPDYKK